MSFGVKKRKTHVKLWKKYSRGKQTYKQLSQQTRLSLSTVQRKINEHEVESQVSHPRKVLIVMDTVYWGRGYGVMVFRDWYNRENLLWKFLEYETIFLYKAGIRELEDRGFEVVAIVADGRRGIFKAFKDIPVQMCQFHQMQIIKRYITSKPKLLAGIELKAIVDRLTRTDEPSFAGWLKDWYERWRIFLNEKTLNPVTNVNNFTHSRIRSAYLSLKHNLPYLFTCQQYPDLGIPNTTNSLDGSFGHIKDKVRVHRGLKRNRRQKLIEELLTKNVTH